MGEYAELFKFAAKAGSLEGYLFERQQLEPLEDWVANIRKMYADLPDNVKRGIKPELAVVLKRTLGYGEKSLDGQIRTKLADLLSSIQGK